MLVPAIMMKEEILKNFKNYYYSDDMFYETGCINNWIPNIEERPEEGDFQYAVVGENNKLIGYIGYFVNFYISSAYNFGIFSFDRGNPIMGRDLIKVMDMLINELCLHRIEWRMIDGNPVKKHYDKFCERYHGTKHVLKDACRDKFGKYHDDIIYEIIIDRKGG